MRRKDREVTDLNEIIKIIDECEIVRLGLADGEYPYIVPVNFAYEVNGEDIDLYIHGAMAGRKYELMRKLDKCSFEMDLPLQMDCLAERKDVTMRYKSVMGTADIVFVEDEKEKEAVIDNIIMARHEETRNFVYNKEAIKVTAIVKLHVTSITGKHNPINSGADL